MLIPVYKPLGISTHRIAQAIGEWAGEKATHTGSLDPMAEGVVIVLTGEDRFNKQELANSKKTYQFEILFGVATDSHDLLGLVTDRENYPLDYKEIEQKLTTALPTFLGKQQQTQPRFSAQRVDGRSGFDLAKKNIPFTAQVNTIEIFSLFCQKFFLKNISTLEAEIYKKISLVDGDFRQKEILMCWQEILQVWKTKKIEQCAVANLEMTCSKKTYVRGLVRDISNNMNISATTYSIVRKSS